jgi:diketogulonate reductase-like aldo/keto reductase
MNITTTFSGTARDQTIQKLLNKKATAVGVTIDQYLINWVESWVENQFTGYYIEKIKAMTPAQLINTLGEIS